MKPNDISNALNEINEEYITSADVIRTTKVKKHSWLKWISAAAAIAVICFAGTKLFYVKDPIVYDTENSGTQYGGYDLPKLIFEQSDTMTYGWEGYLAYDISELENGNPLNEKMVFESLPVYRNNSYNEVGIAYPGIGEDTMLQKLNSLAGGEQGEIVYSRIGDYTEGTGIPDDFVDRIEYVIGNTTIEISSDGSIVASYNNFDGVSLPAEYNFTYSKTTEGEAFEAIAYIYENYGDIIGIAKATFVTSKEYTYSGEEIRSYSIYDFSGDEISDMLNFSFCKVQLAPNDDGKLMLIRIYDGLSCAEKIGDYPIISVKEAKDMLLAGRYITTVPYKIPGEKYIARVELIYRSSVSENIWMPYYRFLIEIPEAKHENGLKEFGAFYVPAVEMEYLSGLPLWNGSFN